MAIYNIPYPPVNSKLVDKDGNMTEGWFNYFRGVSSIFTNNFNEQGLHMPTFSTSALGNSDNGVTWYDTDTNKPKIIVNGSKHTFNTTAD